MVLGTRCDVCARPDETLCSACRAELRAVPSSELSRLAALGVASVTALFEYEGTGSELLRSLKYRNRRSSLRTIVGAARAFLPTDVDLVVPVPPNDTRVRQRRYDLAALIARLAARNLAVPHRQPLARLDHGAQHDRNLEQRAAGPRIEIVGSCAGHVLLVDDVATTGATAIACVDALKSAGATQVSLFVLAVTPTPVGAATPPQL